MATAVEIKNLEGRKVVSSIGMVVLLISFSMLFATLLLGYFLYRVTSEVWPPMGMSKVPLTLPTISTLVIILSSITLFQFEKAFEAKKVKQLLPMFLSTLVFGLVFMAVQFKLWAEMKTMGLYVEAGIFPSLLFTLTWVHAAHIVLGLISLLWLVPVISSKGEEKYTITVSNVGKFWHFLGIVWLLMYIVMFVF